MYESLPEGFRPNLVWLGFCLFTWGFKLLSKRSGKTEMPHSHKTELQSQSPTQAPNGAPTPRLKPFNFAHLSIASPQ